MNVPAVHVDIVDGSRFVVDALALRLRARVDVIPRAKATSWVAYAVAHYPPAPVVCFPAALSDHVPAALKARAVTHEGSLPVVTVASASQGHIARLEDEGARVVERERGLAALVEEITRAASHADMRRHRGGAVLSSREMQVACLFASRRAPSAARVAAILGLRPETVRAHLRRARARLVDEGWDVSSREHLRIALIAEGWLFESF